MGNEVKKSLERKPEDQLGGNYSSQGSEDSG